VFSPLLKAGEVPKNAKLSGTLSVGATELSRAEIKKFSGFVFQDDVILDTMTVNEAIEMSARLRLPKEVDKAARVQQSIETFTLPKAQNTQIGIPGGRKGISGGERKRTSKQSFLTKYMCSFTFLKLRRGHGIDNGAPDFVFR
jgi:ABC-type multidrug transport system ATPase subunit